MVEVKLGAVASGRPSINRRPRVWLLGRCHYSHFGVQKGVFLT